MLRLISLLLPALIPSWRFFKTVAPSPRVEYRLLHRGEAGDWQEDRPRPAHLSFFTMLRRMLWNPAWNEQLFMVSCAERLVEADSPHSSAHSEDEINRRIARLLPMADDTELQFRLVFWYRDGAQLVKEVEFESTPVPVNSLRVRSHDY
ncbi:hypothetical protein TRM7557_00519 [Tritonibacter multivorans]|uniref:Uncharacterized protein n=1 Tax=Tritonibacter multivorans TaxID=928856 RepID=A0A0P1G271_9RHOB|nr:hypothetical protein [Tritonibacter multivorans]MDA7419557.1 hypothetical protein [Tritonibacter multivorans]CUH75704.1 hypothetical protein TRM7557_00519 [Tritonibacter multivorans]SFC62544.1 hypothetical protein SAMN04488049_103264 [Tritonibacter multivorans]